MGVSLIAGLDIGTTKTCAVIGEAIGEPPDLRGFRVCGVGQARTIGVRGDLVTNIEATTETIHQALRESELMAGVTVDQVFAGIAGGHIEGRYSMGVVAVAGDDITEEDVERVHEVARTVALPLDQELLHAVPTDYWVDHRDGIKHPLGMTAARLESEVYLITASATATSNIRKAVSLAGYDVRELVVEPIAAARAVLTEDEKEVGTAMVEIGGGSTDLAVYHDGRIRCVAVLPVGSDAITADLVKGLGIPWAAAQKTKELHGAAVAGIVDPQEIVELPGTAQGHRRLVARELIARIAQDRLEEILGRVRDELEEQELLDRLGAGIVLTGGGAALPGLAMLVQDVLGAPVRMGVPGEGLNGLADSVGRPRFATAVGLALYGAERLAENGQGAFSLTSSVLAKMGVWLKEFF